MFWKNIFIFILHPIMSQSLAVNEDSREKALAKHATCPQELTILKSLLEKAENQIDQFCE
jgi:hypothetical protein